jgi:hypothetical protein
MRAANSRKGMRCRMTCEEGPCHASLRPSESGASATCSDRQVMAAFLCWSGRAACERAYGSQLGTWEATDRSPRTSSPSIPWLRPRPAPRTLGEQLRIKRQTSACPARRRRRSLAWMREHWRGGSEANGVQPRSARTSWMTYCRTSDRRKSKYFSATHGDTAISASLIESL